jgi:serine/threonine-protein kinase
MCPDDGTVLELKLDPMAAQLGKVLDSKYRLDSFLSQGGMGAVFKATHVMLGKTVAVKLINPELVTSPEVVRRFQREARAATALNHPNIVSVYDLGQTPEGTLYIAMEFVDGPSLKQVITTGGPIAPGRTIAILRQVASALGVAHAHKIVHRDLKPHNIMLARRGPDGQETVKLVDFGIAKTFDESTQLTMAGDTIGTPHYMAPEQAAGGQVDSRSDLYSLGVIVYEMLTGEVPFNDNSTAAILVKHLKDIPQKPSLRNPRVPISPELEAIALKCLEKDPGARFQSAEEFGAALELAALAIPDAGMQMDVTMPMAAAAAVPPVATAATVRVDRSAATEPARAAAPPPPAPAKPMAAGPPARPAGDTRPTVMGAAVVAAGPQSKSSNKGLIAGFVAVALVLVGVGVYMNRPSAPAADQTAAATTPAPAAVPASAQPDTSASQTTAQTPAPDQTPAPAPTASAASAPSAVSATPKTAAAPKAAASTVAVAAPAAQPASTPARAAAARVLQGSEPARPAPAAAGFPEAPAVFFHCNGAPDICSPLRAAVDDALEKAGLSSVRTAARADIDVSAEADVVQENTNRQFGTTFAVRNYSIDVSGETTHTNEVVSMPAPTSVSFDASFGSERAVEKARTVASDIVDRVKAFTRKKRGG